MSSAENLTKVNNAYREKRFDEVIAIAAPMLESGDLPAEAVCCLGYAYFQKGQFVQSCRCWDLLLKENWLKETRYQLGYNRASACYMAAQSEAKADRFESAASLLAVFCDWYPGDNQAKALLSKLQKLAVLQRSNDGLDGAERLIDDCAWSEAADQLLKVRSDLCRSGEPINGPAA